MEKRAIQLIVLSAVALFLILTPIVSAQTYSKFNRFTDNVKLFFSGGDNKVRLALEIREKEVNSAMENVQNGNDEKADENLEKAWEKIQLVQEKVSINTANEVKESSKEVRENIMNKENLSNKFEVYALEEEKTGLTAEWVIEVGGKEGQNSTNWVVNGTIGENRVWEIETRIGEIDGEISNWVVENSIGKDGEGDNGLMWEIKTEVAEGKDNGLKWEVKTSVAGDGTLKNDPLPVPDLNKVNPDLYDPNARAPGDSRDGDCGDGVVCGGEGDIIENVAGDNVIDGVTGTEGTEPSITGEVISSGEKESSFLEFIKRIFGLNKD